MTRLLIRRLSCGTRALQEPRINQLGIQYLSEGLHKRVFPKNPPKNYTKVKNNGLLQISKRHLDQSGLLGKKTQINEPINIENFPSLIGGNSLDEHFFKIGLKSSEPYLTMCNEFLSEKQSLPPRPSKWVFRPGWYRYELDKEPEPVPYPLEQQLVFDVEVMYKVSPYPVLATAVSPKAWYGWVSPALTEKTKRKASIDWEHLIPMNTLKEEKVVIGYNVSYDRARILEEYNIKQSKAFYLDGMSLHVATSGLSTNQRPLWHKHKKMTKTNESDDNDEHEIATSGDMDNSTQSSKQLAQDLIDDPWLTKGAPNSLANVAEFHCGILLDKKVRDAFDTHDVNDIINDFNSLMDYCAEDVNATFEVTKKLFPAYKEKIPHPVSFAALRHLGTLILPTTKKWESYIESAESIYNENRDSVTNILKDRVNELIAFIEKGDKKLKPDIENDPWLKQLNWTIKEPRYKKNGEPAARQAFLTGYPEWYRELFKTTSDSKTDEKTKDLNISVRTRVTPLLLRLKWEGHTLFWTESNGWCFKVPYEDKIISEMEGKGYIRAKLSDEDQDLYYDDLHPEDVTSFELFKVPHPDGNNKRCTAIMSKSYAQYFQNGVLTSEYSYAQEILDLNTTASYWMGNRSRILDQFVVYSKPDSKNSFFPTKKESKEHPDMGIILPKLITMGTITRRAVENTWLTASNAKKNRIGSELKSLVEAPKGYTFVGADVDSEELWIAALIGDSVFKIHGATALSWMTLEGDKNHKTDLHSKTADILGISRNDAKIFNYGRIYGAGVKFATRLLKQCNTKLSDEEAEAMAKKLYVETKGSHGKSKFFDRRLYHGGTESVMFNALESIAHLKDPRTPVLGASITDALTSQNLNKNNFLTSRTNWAIQSSGVDYLHLLIVSMDYLIRKYKVQARLMITVHDELRYLVKEEDKYRVALLLQISNLWTRAMFAERLGFNELPQSVAFFSEVDIDRVLRKEVTLECTTPSQPDPIPPGESVDIFKLLELTDNGKILKPSNSNDANRNTNEELRFKSNPKIMEKLNEGLTDQMKLVKVKMELATSKEEFRKNVYEFAKVKKSSEFDYLQPVSGMIDPDSAPKKQKVKKVEEDDDVASNGEEEFKAMFSEDRTKTKVTTKRGDKTSKDHRTKVANSRSGAVPHKAITTDRPSKVPDEPDIESEPTRLLKRRNPLFKSLSGSFGESSTMDMDSRYTGKRAFEEDFSDDFDPLPTEGHQPKRRPEDFESIKLVPIQRHNRQTHRL